VCLGASLFLLPKHHPSPLLQPLFSCYFSHYYVTFFSPGWWHECWTTTANSIQSTDWCLCYCSHSITPVICNQLFSQTLGSEYLHQLSGRQIQMNLWSHLIMSTLTFSLCQLLTKWSMVSSNMMTLSRAWQFVNMHCTGQIAPAGCTQGTRSVPNNYRVYIIQYDSCIIGTTKVWAWCTKKKYHQPHFSHTTMWQHWLGKTRSTGNAFNKLLHNIKNFYILYFNLFYCFMGQTCTKGLLVTCTNSHIVHYITLHTINYLAKTSWFYRMFQFVVGGYVRWHLAKIMQRTVIIIIKVCYKMIPEKVFEFRFE